jgi:hypothetical protein
VLEDTAQSQTKTVPDDSGPISWWSWRPGIKPRNALLIGASFSLIALLFISLGVVVLTLSIVDSVSSPITVPGVASRHMIAGLSSSYYLTLRLHTQGFPSSVSVEVSVAAYHAIHDGDAVLAEYSPHLHVLNALDSLDQHYILPDSGAAGILLGTIALLLLGVVLLPYPAVLARWGWRDLYAKQYLQQEQSQMTGTVVALRAATETHMRRPGLLPRRGVRTWYGIALLPTNYTGDTRTARVVTFALNSETYRTVAEDAEVTITYSPHLHYVYSLKDADKKSE